MAFGIGRHPVRRVALARPGRRARVQVRGALAVALAVGLLAACGGDARRDAEAGGLAGTPAGGTAGASPARIARLVAALRGPDYGAAVSAADSLAHVGPAATDALIPLIAGTDVRARAFAVRAAAGYGPRAAAAVPALITVLRRGPEDPAFAPAVRALAAIGPAASPATGALAAILDDPGAFNAHRDVLQALGAIGPGARAAVPAVLRQLPTAPNGAAAAAAGRIGGPDALTALTRELLTPPGPPAGNPPDTVAVALARLGAPGLAVLARAADAAQPAVRHAAVVGYRSLGAAGVPGLVRALADGRPCRYPYGNLGDFTDPVACRTDAASALGEIGRAAAAALPALERVLSESTDAGSQDAARTAIARIRR